MCYTRNINHTWLISILVTAWNTREITANPFVTERIDIIPYREAITVGELSTTQYIVLMLVTLQIAFLYGIGILPLYIDLFGTTGNKKGDKFNEIDPEDLPIEFSGLTAPNDIGGISSPAIARVDWLEKATSESSSYVHYQGDVVNGVRRGSFINNGTTNKLNSYKEDYVDFSDGRHVLERFIINYY